MVWILLFKVLLKRQDDYDLTEQLMGHEKAQAASIGDIGFLISSQLTKLVSVWPQTTKKAAEGT